MNTTEAKLYLSYDDVQKFVLSMGREILLSGWKPDYIVGITRGGLLPATLLSQFLKVPMSSLNVSLRDNNMIGPESNCWMAEDAFGYIDSEVRDKIENASDPNKRKNILIVEDINDTGATFNWIINDWKSGCLPDSPAWDDIFGHNVRTFAVINNEASDYKDINYTGLTINKNEEDLWVIFPWEDFWLPKP